MSAECSVCVSQVMVGAYGASAGGGRGALLPAPAPGKAVIARGPTRNANGAKEPDGPPVTVFIGNISSRAPDAMIRALLSACGPVLSWKRVSTFGFSEFASPEAALRCVRLLNSRAVADKQLLARTDGKMQALVDTYKSEYRLACSANRAEPSWAELTRACVRSRAALAAGAGGRRARHGRRGLVPGRATAGAGRRRRAPSAADHARLSGRHQQLRNATER